MRTVPLLLLGLLTACAASQPSVTEPDAPVADQSLKLAPALSTPLPEFKPLSVPSVALPNSKIHWDWVIGAKDTSKLSAAGLNLIDVDGFNASAADVARFHSQGALAVCYLDVGSLEQGRPDTNDYPAYLKLARDKRWGEDFLDIRDVFKPDSVFAKILDKRFAMCKGKNFDIVEPDNLQNAENAKGSGLTLQDQFNFDGWVADHVHAAGMLALQKNDPDMSLRTDNQGRRLVDLFDGILNEQCAQYKECGSLDAYTKAGKLTLDTEYKQGVTLPCGTASAPISAIGRDVALKAPGMNGYRYTACK